MHATMDMRERERERAPDRENSAMPRPANRRVILEHSPVDWDPTAGGRDGIEYPEEPGDATTHKATLDGIAISGAEHVSAEDHADDLGRP